MADSLAGLGITWDDDGRPDGFQVGKSAAILDWQHAKEAREFAAYCQRLYARNWARRERAEHPERARARLKRWRDANRERLRQTSRERMRKVYEVRRPTCICDECGKLWRPAPKYAAKPGVRKRKARFCSLRCANRWHGQRRPYRYAGIRCMTIKARVLAILAATPWLTPAEVAARDERIKPTSVATLLCVWSAHGELVERRKRRPGRAYEYAAKETRHAPK